MSAGVGDAAAARYAKTFLAEVATAESMAADDLAGMMNCDECGGRHRATFVFNNRERGWHELLGEGGWRSPKRSRGRR